MEYYYDCVENNHDDASVAELKSCIKDIYVRSSWTQRGRAFHLHEYSLELITEQEAEEDPELPVLYIKGTCNADGTFPVFNDPPRLFFAPRIQQLRQMNRKKNRKKNCFKRFLTA